MVKKHITIRHDGKLMCKVVGSVFSAVPVAGQFSDQQTLCRAATSRGIQPRLTGRSLYLSKPFQQALNEVIEEGQELIIYDPRCAGLINVPGRRWPWRSGDIFTLIWRKVPPPIIRFLHLPMTLAVFHQELAQASAPGS